MNSIILAGVLWRAVLTLPDGELPFNFEWKAQEKQMIIHNGDERITCDEISFKGDSVFIRLPVFDSEFRLRIEENKMHGDWINYSRKTNQRISFHAEKNQDYRFKNNPAKATVDFSGRWSTNFSPGTADSSFAIGVFKQNENHLTGTFLTTTGDYRYLEGLAEGDSLFLSCFDGAHAYLFKAKMENKKIKGLYLSGNYGKENWIAERNEKIELPDAASLTFLKKEYDKVFFSFPDLDSTVISLSDEKFKNKVIVIQIMGSWCPNCMDETAFLSPFYKNYRSKGFEIIGLSFEKTSDFQKAVSNVRRMKDRFKIDYTLLLPGNRENANQALPMLNKVMGYPTTIFIDKKGKVRKIHTGFSGPATGQDYEKFKEEFTAFIEQLIREN